jgi:hypothetical protein
LYVARCALTVELDPGQPGGAGDGHRVSGRFDTENADGGNPVGHGLHELGDLCGRHHPGAGRQDKADGVRSRFHGFPD